MQWEASLRRPYLLLWVVLDVKVVIHYFHSIFSPIFIKGSSVWVNGTSRLSVLFLACGRCPWILCMMHRVLLLRVTHGGLHHWGVTASRWIAQWLCRQRLYVVGCRPGGTTTSTECGFSPLVVGVRELSESIAKCYLCWWLWYPLAPFTSLEVSPRYSV